MFCSFAELCKFILHLTQLSLNLFKGILLVSQFFVQNLRMLLEGLNPAFRFK